MKFKDLGTRFISAIVIAAICIVPVWLGGAWFAGLAALVGGRIVYEWVRMSDSDHNIIAYLILGSGLLASIVAAFLGAWSYALAIALVFAFVALIERAARGGALWAGFGALYVILPCLAMIFVRSSADGLALFFFILLIVVGADVGAYLGGSQIGGPKIAPKLSPNKTWAGFVSGLLLGCTIGAVFMGLKGGSPLYGVVLAVPIVVLSVIGDFLESGIKRRLEVKDTGGLIPGHGGVLDRIDSLMFAMVFAAFAYVLAPHLWPF